MGGNDRIDFGLEFGLGEKERFGRHWEQLEIGECVLQEFGHQEGPVEVDLVLVLFF